MKWTNLAIIFFLLELSLFIILDMRTFNLAAIVNQKVEYNKALDSAIDDSVINLVEVDRQKELVLNKEKVVEQFYQALYANFGIMGNPSLEKKLKEYVPVILVTDEDGFYLYYSDTYDTGEENIITQYWSEKQPYVYEISNYIINFTLNTFLTVYDKNTCEIYEGEYKDLQDMFQNTLLAEEETFHMVRRNAIISAIEVKMNYYINKYNNIAKQFGITYQFWLPEIDKTDWYRTIDDISMLVLFQGYPYRFDSMDTYNRYAIGGARIKKSRVYYISEENGRKFYHKSDCNHLSKSGHTTAFYTREECALEGAYPCSVMINRNESGDTIP
ncbi:hypothetical protein [Anaerocolumna sp.]|uniref:hypothetical protein n=1 Tax=Anaerocolumna sp. TaxID=2041569 RepID=UPI0028B0B1B3|nr:hypothetical protein [Anaerocolumna sp.]